MTVSTIGNYIQGVYTVTSQETKLSDLLTQQETGYKTQNYGELGTQANAQIIYTNATSSISVYNSNITTAQSRISTADSIYTEISDIVNDISSQVTELYTASQPYTSATTASLNAAAKSALSQINSLLNTSLNDRYLFSGSASSVEPMVNDSSVNTGLLGSSAGGTTGLPSSYTSASANYADVCNYFTTVTNYYNGSTDGVENSVQVTSTTMVTYGDSADDTSLQTVLRAIYAAANLQPTTNAGSSDADKSEFQNYLSDIGNDLTAGMTGGTIANATTGGSTTVLGLNTVQGIQGDVYTQLGDIASQNSTAQNYLSTNLGNVQDADLASVATQIVNLETQIQASFKAISIISSLSLASYI